MSVGPTQATFAGTLVDEWVELGLTEAVVCPGSRSTPLALALAARPEVRLHVRLDERSAAFYALGLGLASGRPPLILVTSGTAAAELHPAVVEAHQARVPLIVCTADRPPELHHVGAPQTVDQVRLYGPAVRWFADPGVPDPATAHTWRPLATRVLAEATAGPSGPGPVHLNLAFRDPLVGRPGPLPARRPGDRTRRTGLALAAAGSAGVGPWAGRRGIVVAGADCGPHQAVAELAARLGWPILADPRSGLRRPGSGAVAAADPLLRDPPARERLRPESVLLLGGPWVSKAVQALVAEAVAGGAEVVSLDPWWGWADPGRVVTTRIHAQPGPWLTQALGELGADPPSSPWRDTWLEAELVAQEALDEVLGEHQAGGTGLSEPLVARSVLAAAPSPGRLLAASSMPVRDLEWFGACREDPPQVLANRGANGIDGVTSTALGLAAAGPEPVVALLGDLAFLHDVSALVRLGGEEGPGACLLVVVDNGGGGIFNFLPQAEAVEAGSFELLFGTPPASDLGAVAAGFGVAVTEVREAGQLALALSEWARTGGLRLIRARVPDRRANVALHRRIEEAVAKAVAPVLGL